MTATVPAIATIVTVCGLFQNSFKSSVKRLKLMLGKIFLKIQLTGKQATTLVVTANAPATNFVVWFRERLMGEWL